MRKPRWICPRCGVRNRLRSWACRRCRSKLDLQRRLDQALLWAGALR
jgi:ribosomal protein L40E